MCISVPRKIAGAHADEMHVSKGYGPDPGCVFVPPGEQGGHEAGGLGRRAGTVGVRGGGAGPGRDVP